MTQIRQGDVVLSHFNGAFRYAGVAAGPARSSRKPDFGFKGGYWSDDGWIVDVQFVEFSVPVKPQDHLDRYFQVAPAKYAPMNSDGRVNQQYLFRLPEDLGSLYLVAGGVSEDTLRSAIRYDPSIDQLIDDAEEVLNDPGLTVTEKHVLTTARVGQGLFKEHVRKFEPKCRLTGMTDPRYLIASHMKPWRDSNNTERLDGHNGLLLSPHVDHLFDRGLITFGNSGRVSVSTEIASTVPLLWQLDLNQSGRRFSKQQLPYLEYHRDVIFHAT